MRRYTAATALLAILACAGPQEAGNGDTEVEVLTGEGRVMSQGLTSGALAFDWELVNPTARNATLDKIEWVLTVNDASVFRGTVEPKAVAKPGSKTQGVMRVGFDLGTSPEAIRKRAAQQVLRYDVQADFYVGSRSAEVFGSEWHGELLAPRLPQVEARIGASRSDESIAIDISVSVSNRNPFPIRVEALPFTLAVGGIVVKRGTLMEIAQTLEPASEVQFDLTQSLDSEETLEVAKRLLAREAQEFELTTLLEMKGISIPQKAAGVVEPPRR